MSTERNVSVRWTGRDKVFEGRAGSTAPIYLDGDSEAGPSPTEMLLMSLAACMGIDINVILDKGRVPAESLVVDVSGTRAPEPPRRFVSLRIAVTVEGLAEQDQPKLERSVQLSRDKYCSVFHTLDPELDVEVSAARA